MNSETSAMTVLGTQIQIASLAITVNPRLLKKPSPIGDTSIGRHGKKNLSELNGASNATPRPPSVNMSRNGWDSVIAAKNRATFHLAIGIPEPISADTIRPTSIANATECVIPRWPNILPYPIPNRKASTSRSGKSGHINVRTQNRAGSFLDWNAVPRADAKTACEKIVGIW